MLPIFASSAEAHSRSIADALAYLLGAVLVVGSLAALWGICALVAHLVRLLLPESPPNTPTPKPMTASPEPAPSGSGEPEIPAHIVAVIAAAVATVSRKPVRIVSIKPMNNAWERAGRQTVLTSHHIR